MLIMVTATSHPTLFKALDMIIRDNGPGSNPNETGLEQIAFDQERKDFLAVADETLSHLTTDELEILAIGEADARLEMLRRNHALEPIDEFLEEFFDNYNGFPV